MIVQARHTGEVIDENKTRYLYWWLLAAIFLEYARPQAIVPLLGQLKVSSLVPLLLLVITLFSQGLRPFKVIFSDRSSLWLIAYIALVLISVPLAHVTLYAYTTFKLVLGYFFLFLIIARVATSVGRLRGIFISLIVSHLFLIGVTPAILTNPSVRSYVSGGTFLGDGNDFALSMCILVPMAVELALGTKKRLSQLVAWTSCVLILMSIVASQSRGATLGVIALLGFLWMFARAKFAVLVVIGCIGLLVAVYASDNYFQRMSTISSYKEESSAARRVEAWKSSIRMAADNPMTGVGAGNFPTAYGHQYKPANAWSDAWMTAHSVYFLVLGELGLPGLLVLCVLVFGNIRATMSARRRILMTGSDPPPPVAEMPRMLYLLTGSMIGFAVAGAFLSVSYYPHIFVLTGILVSARTISRDNVERPSQNVVGRRGGPRQSPVLWGNALGNKRSPTEARRAISSELEVNERLCMQRRKNNQRQ